MTYACTDAIIAHAKLVGLIIHTIKAENIK